MNVRIAPSLFICGVIFFAAGCSGSMTAPSALDGASSARAAALAAQGSGEGPSPSRFGNRSIGAVYVTSQDLYYDTFVVKDPLPMAGRFQLIEDGQTEFGPGQPGYLGGRWWEDLNGNGVQDPDDHYFLCPLLPPGREQP